MPKSEVVDIDIEVLHWTSSAILVDAGLDENVWLPRSWCEWEGDLRHGKLTLTMEARHAEMKGLTS